MFSRFTLATLMAALMLSGCARHAADSSTSAQAAPVENDNMPSQFESGPTVINVSHLVTRTDDGSTVYVTVDGEEAGLLPKGEKKEIRVPAGKHQVGGYVQTLFGFGKVTIPPVAVTTDTQGAKNVVYSVTRQKPAFSETASGEKTTPVNNS